MPFDLVLGHVCRRRWPGGIISVRRHTVHERGRPPVGASGAWPAEGGLSVHRRASSVVELTMSESAKSSALAGEPQPASGRRASGKSSSNPVAVIFTPRSIGVRDAPPFFLEQEVVQNVTVY